MRQAEVGRPGMKLAHVRAVALLLLAVALGGCRGGLSLGVDGEDAGSQPSGPPLSLRFDGLTEGQVLQVGAVTPLKVLAKYADQSELDVTAKVVIASTDPGIADVDANTHALKAVAKGTVSITATWANDDGDGGTLSTTLGLEVQSVGGNDTVLIEVAPATLALAPGFGRQLAANGTQADNSQRSVTKTATWTSSNTGVCMVDDGANKGFVTAVAEGTCTITAAL
ncbi:MAG: Ig-like domain-containing protein, partial [Deltaproteobacteria bacterium]|nr:Ig-like domain-containing protein [Deltaproteobacteria bacterium]